MMIESRDIGAIRSLRGRAAVNRVHGRERPSEFLKRTKLLRRAFLAAAGNGTAGLAAAGVMRSGAVASAIAISPTPSRAETGAPLAQSSEIRSRNGVLEAMLVAAPGTVRLDAVAIPGFLYNNAYLPPLLRVQTGDTMRLRFRNDLPEDPSNLHFHGMTVSPQGNSDNVFVHVHPGQEFAYEVKIPADGRQGPGLFWYHPHLHGVVAKQILGGMSGGLVVDGFERYFPMVKDLPERFLLIKHVEHTEGEIISINGQIDPILTLRPGEAQFWRIAHIGATLFIKLHIEGTSLYVLATDGHPLSRPRRMTQLFLGPGERIEAIAIGPPPGEYAVRTLPFHNQAWRTPDPPVQIATIASAGAPAPAQPRETEIAAQQAQGRRWIDDVREAAIARRRTLEYSRTDDRRLFMIDGRVMDEGRVDQTVRLGDTEEWTIVNRDQQYHSFHFTRRPFS
jgi:FtsP/CotA-like multicopper oxidase with cupredoxin domain